MIWTFLLTTIILSATTCGCGGVSAGGPSWPSTWGWWTEVGGCINTAYFVWNEWLLQKKVEKLPQWFKNQFDKASTAPKVEQVICHLINTERRGLVWQPVRRMSPLHPKYLKVPLEEVQQQKVIIHLSTLAQFSPAFFSFFFFSCKIPVYSISNYQAAYNDVNKYNVRLVNGRNRMGFSFLLKAENKGQWQKHISR